MSRLENKILSRLSVLIVDDEPVARKILREELDLLSSVEVVGEAENGELALGEISYLKPDVVFLDIQMPIMGGFELIDRLNDGHLPVIIMVTAFDQHAVQAFESGAIDYLLKPIKQERLAQAIERAKRVFLNRSEVAESIAKLQEINPVVSAASRPHRKIVGKIGEEFFLLNPSEVLAFQADGDLTWIITAKQRYAATQNLKSLEERLRNSSFRRIHRNALVNLEQIRKMSIMSSQRWLITLNNGHEFIVSKRQAKYVRDVLHW